MYTIPEARHAFDQIRTNERTNLITIPAQTNLVFWKHPTLIPALFHDRTIFPLNVSVCMAFNCGCWRTWKEEPSGEVSPDLKPSRLAYSARWLASFASYISPLFSQNEIVATDGPGRRRIGKGPKDDTESCTDYRRRQRLRQIDSNDSPHPMGRMGNPKKSHTASRGCCRMRLPS